MIYGHERQDDDHQPSTDENGLGARIDRNAVEIDELAYDLVEISMTIRTTAAAAALVVDELVLDAIENLLVRDYFLSGRKHVHAMILGLFNNQKTNTLIKNTPLFIITASTKTLT